MCHVYMDYTYTDDAIDTHHTNIHNTGGTDETELTDALLASGLEGTASSSSSAAGVRGSIWMRWVDIGTSSSSWLVGSRCVPLTVPHNTLHDTKQVKWEAYPTPVGQGLALRLSTVGEASFVRWHSKGDYLASVVPNGGARAVMIHQVCEYVRACVCVGCWETGAGQAGISSQACVCISLSRPPSATPMSFKTQ